MNESLTFRKAERLRHKSLINSLFQRGGNIYAWPLRLVYHNFSSEEMHALFRHGIPEHIAPLQMLVTIPKKKRKKAVDRVLLRRRIREAYRLNRLNVKKNLPLKSEKEVTLSLAFIYLSDKNEDYTLIETSMKKLLSKLREKLFYTINNLKD